MLENKFEINKILNKAFENRNSADYIDFLISINDKKIPLKESSVDSRTYHYWKNNGLIKGENKKGTWEILSFVEFIWIECINEMREFGVPFNTIKKVRDKAFTTVDADEIFTEVKTLLKDNKQVYRERYDDLMKVFESYAKNNMKNEIQKQYLLDLISSESFIDEMINKKYSIKYSLFEIGLAPCIRTSVEAGLIIYKNDIKFFIYDKEDTDYSELSDFFEPHVYISINKVIARFLNDGNTQKYINQYKLMSENNLKILAFMQERDFENIQIINDKSTIQLVGELNMPYTQKKYDELVKEAEVKNLFCDITIKRHGGKFATIEFVEKKQIKK